MLFRGEGDSVFDHPPNEATRIVEIAKTDKADTLTHTIRILRERHHCVVVRPNNALRRSMFACKQPKKG